MVHSLYPRSVLQLFFILMIAALGCQPSPDDFAVQIHDLHSGVAEMSYSFPQAEDAVSAGTCTEVEELAEKVDTLRATGSTESLVRKAGLALWEACQGFSSAVREEREKQQRMNSLLQNNPELRPLLQNPAFSGEVPKAKWHDMTFSEAFELENSCKSLTAYDLVAAPRIPVSCSWTRSSRTPFVIPRYVPPK